MTAIELITRAYRLVNIIDENAAPSAEQGADGLASLNEMLAMWDRDGIRLGWTMVADQSDTVPLDVQDIRAVRFNLAVELAGEFGIDASPRVQQIANETYAALCKAHRLKFESSLELLPTPAAYWWGRSGSIESGGT